MLLKPIPAMINNKPTINGLPAQPISIMAKLVSVVPANRTFMAPILLAIRPEDI